VLATAGVGVEGNQQVAALEQVVDGVRERLREMG
jgi:hypothetical protein